MGSINEELCVHSIAALYDKDIAHAMQYPDESLGVRFCTHIHWKCLSAYSVYTNTRTHILQAYFFRYQTYQISDTAFAFCI